eukprot:3482567-Rhodomonas_salina.1
MEILAPCRCLRSVVRSARDGVQAASHTEFPADIRQLKVGADITEEGYTDDHIQIIIGGRTMASYIMGDVNSYIWMLARDGFEREEVRSPACFAVFLPHPLVSTPLTHFVPLPPASSSAVSSKARGQHARPS